MKTTHTHMHTHTCSHELKWTVWFIWVCIFMVLLHLSACMFTDTEVFLWAKSPYSPFPQLSGHFSRLIVCGGPGGSLWHWLMVGMVNVIMPHWPQSGSPLLILPLQSPQVLYSTNRQSCCFQTLHMQISHYGTSNCLKHCFKNIIFDFQVMFKIV